MKFKGSGPLVVFCRMKGPGGRVREVPAILAPSYEYCLVLKNDAMQLGYSSVTFRQEDWADISPAEVLHITSTKGIEVATLIKLKEVAVGPLKAENVEAIVTKSEFPMLVPVGAFLGRSFLRHFRLDVDPKSDTFSLDPTG